MQMMRIWIRWRQWCVALVIPILLTAADGKTDPKPSSYAPAQDLAAQIDVFVKQIENDLAAEADYADEQKDRIVKDANTVVVIAQVLANHDEEHALRKAAPEIVTAASKLAESTGKYSDAKSAFDALKMSLQSAKGGEVGWKPVAEVASLMKQVPIVNNKLRAGVTGRRFDRTIDQSAGQAATLAAIAEASLHDTTYCASKEDEVEWAKVCAAMRDAASEVRVAVRKKDQATAQAGLAKLVKTCDQCHEKFRE